MSERLDTTPAEVPASSGGSAATLPRTALLYTDEALLAHVEQTLAALRVPVVYRAALAQADRSALAGAHPEIALINLDDRCGEELGALTATLDAAGVPIVFNDADISHGLEGWARARWARHLVAKLCGKDDVDPPRPTEASASAPAKALPAAPAAPVAEATAPLVLEIAETSQAIEPPLQAESASLPLSKGEIDSLLADFPSDATVGGADTETLSAHVDALLANAADSASNEPAPWDVTFVEAEPEHAPSGPAKAEASGSAPAEASARPVTAPSADQWQLVDDFTPVAPAAKPAAPAPSTSFDSGLALELEPLAPSEKGQ